MPKVNRRPARRAVLVLLILAAAGLTQTAGRAAAPCSVPSFTAPSTYRVRSVRALAAADFNGDGRLDLAAANESGFSTVSILLGDGAGGFAAARDFETGRNPAAVAAGDLNGDGKIDLVTANESNIEGDISLLFGDGAGNFGRAQGLTLSSPGLSSTASSVAIDDFSGDGKVDIAVLFRSSNGVRIVVGDGAGAFPTSYGFGAAASFPVDMSVGDFNADGRPDVAVASLSANGLTVIVNNGAGVAGTATGYPIGTGASAVVARDLNGDGKTDLAVGNGSSPTVAVLAGDGAGGFGPQTNFGAGVSAVGDLTSEDFNGDGHVDLAVATGPDSVLILQGDGAGAFSAAANYAAGASNLQAILARDFNADGRPDLAAALLNTRNVSVLLNACGDGVPPSTLQFYPAGFGAMEGFTVSVQVTRNGALGGAAGVDYNTSDGTAVAPADYTPASGTLVFAEGEIAKTFSVTVADDNVSEIDETVNLTLSNATGAATLGSPAAALLHIIGSDGVPAVSVGDVTVAEGNGGTTSADFTVSLGNPSGSVVTVGYETAAVTATAGEDFAAAAGTLTFAPGETAKTVSVSVHGDTLAEISEAFTLTLKNPTNSTLADAQGLGTIHDDDSACPAPNFGPPADFNVGASPLPLVGGDFNGDGKRDLVVGNFAASTVSVLLGDGAGGFSGPTNFAAGVTPRSIAAGDFNGDGKTDLALAGTSFTEHVSVLLGNGAGGFSAPTNFAAGSNPRGVAAGDFNADGKLDLAVTAGSASVSVLHGNGGGGFGAATSYAVGTSPVSVAVGDFNADSRPDLAVANQNSNSVSVLINNGAGGFGPASNFGAGENPQHVVVGDFNGDGKNDLATPNITSGDVSVLLGNGAGAFAAASSYAAGNRPSHMIADDINGDGRLDLVVGNGGPNFPPTGSISVLFGNGLGAFSPPAAFLAGETRRLGVASGDYNGDGKTDLVATGFDSGNVSLLLNVCDAQGPTRVRFAAEQFAVGEGDRAAVVTVTRTGDASNAFTVGYATGGGTASERSDYTPVAGTLRFAVGETSKTFAVFITDDAFAETPETVGLALGGPVGAVVGGPSVATLTITSNDAADGPSPVKDGSFNTSFFVRQHYLDFLNREPDDSGLAFWKNQIDECEGRPAAERQGCREVRRINVSAAFFLSIEFQETGFLVYRAYGAAFGTRRVGATVPLTLQEFLPDTQEVSRGVVIGQPGAEALLESNKAAYFDRFVERPQFLALYPASMSHQDYVDSLVANTGFAVSNSERNLLVARLTRGEMTRAQALRAVAENSLFRTNETRRAFVLMQYFGYLRRNPNDAPEQNLDFGGYNFWLSKLNSFGGNYVAAEMVKAFITSGEYQRRFGQ